MSASNSCIVEVRTTGSDTLCSGGFDPTQTAGMLTDGTVDAGTGNTSAPVFSSPSYTFVAGDAGAWVYVASGANCYPGWYQIASVSGGKATLSAAIGSATWMSIKAAYSLNTSAGIASVGTPTGIRWSIDYSKQNSARFSFTDITRVTNTTCTSAANPFGKQMVGNTLYLVSGTTVTAGIYVITSVTGTTATLNTAYSSGASTNGTGYMGGALASIGNFGLQYIDGCSMSIKSGTYSVDISGASNLVGGRLARGSVVNGVVAVYEGYNSVLGDQPSMSSGNQPVFQVSVGAASLAYVFGINTWTGRCRFLTVDLNNKAFAGGFLSHHCYRCRVLNISSSGAGYAASTSFGTTWYQCYAAGFATTSTSTGFFNFQGTALECVAYNCTVGFNVQNTIKCIATACTSGFSQSPNLISCTAYNCGTGFGMYQTAVAKDCLAHTCTNAFSHLSTTGPNNGTIVVNSKAYNCTNLSVNTANFYILDLSALGSDPMPNAGSGDFSVVVGSPWMRNSQNTNWSLFSAISTPDDYANVGAWIGRDPVLFPPVGCGFVQ